MIRNHLILGQPLIPHENFYRTHPCTRSGVSLYLFLEGFGETSVCPSRSWACGASLSVSSGRFCCFMILLPAGGCLFERTSSSLGLW